MAAPHTSSEHPREFPWVPLLVLSTLTFVFVTSEFLPTGLLPEMSHELGVSESQVGFLITLFAATVVVTTAPLTALTHRHSRKSLLIALILLFAIANLLAAAAPTYVLLALARVLGGVAHGLFWAVVSAYTAGLVNHRHIGRAVAITAGGGTAAFVLGVPVGTLLGHALGWRLAFVAIAVVVLVLMVLVIRFLPAIQHREKLATGEIALPMRNDRTIPGVIIVCAIVTIVILGHNTFYTYIAVFLINPVGVAPGSVAGILFVYGAAGAIGLALAGTLSDRFPRSAFVAVTVVVAVSVLAIGLFPQVPWVVIAATVAWGIGFGGVPAMMQARLLRTASPRVRDLASAYLTTSFNLSIGGGALLGGLLLDRVGIRVLPFVAVVLVLVGVAVAIGGDAWLRRREANRIH
jgi:DHA1 family inner membrane transport protein